MKPTALVEHHFRSTATFWDDVYLQETLDGSLYRQRAEAVLAYVDSINLPADARVLEIGCGAGRLSAALASRGFHVQAIDVTDEMVEATARTARQFGVADRVRVARGDVHALGFSNATFDLVLAIGVLEWTPTLTAPLAEMTRVAKRGGHVIVNVDNRWALHCLLDPWQNPVLQELKRKARRAMELVGMRKPRARPSRRSRPELDRALASVGLTKRAGLTGGFGPFALFGKRIVPDGAGVAIHNKLQRWADQGSPVSRAGGETYLTLSVKS